MSWWYKKSTDKKVSKYYVTFILVILKWLCRDSKIAHLMKFRNLQTHPNDDEHLSMPVS